MNEYRRHNEKWFEGKQAKLLDDIQSPSQFIKKGTILTITGKYNGFTLKTKTCEHCGVAVFIRKVSPLHLELIN
jgi:hypothetical protein